MSAAAVGPVPGVRRLLMTTDTVGGVWTYALQLCAALAPAVERIALAACGPAPSARQRREAAALPHVELHEGPFRLEWMADPWADVAAAGRWLADLAARFRPDLAHLNQFAFGAVPLGAPRLVVGHSCVLSWHEAVRGRPAGLEWARYRREVAAGLRAAELVTAPTAAMLAALARHYGPFRAGPVVPNGRQADEFVAGPKEPRIFCAARLWDEAKNATALARVARRLPWPVRIAGEGRHPDEAGGPAPATPAGAVLLGPLPPARVAREMGRAAIYALPARYEPFGLSALEAGLSGCALVLGDLPSLREVWGEAALYVPPQDEEALAAALLALIEDEPRRRRLAAAARGRALRYTPERMAARTLGLYARMTAGQAARSGRAAGP